MGTCIVQSEIDSVQSGGLRTKTAPQLKLEAFIDGHAWSKAPAWPMCPSNRTQRTLVRLYAWLAESAMPAVISCELLGSNLGFRVDN